MRNYIVIILALLFSSAFYTLSFAQTDGDIAHVGPLGVYVISGNKLASESHPSGDITGYRIERKQNGESDWKLITEQSTPDTRGDLERALVEAFNDISYSLSTENILIEKTWLQLEKYHLIDSLPTRGSMLPMRIALGLVYLDRDVKQGMSYEYRVSTITTDGRSKDSKTQKITFQTKIAPGEIYKKARRYADSSSARLLWHKSDNTLPTSLAVYRKNTFGDFQRINIRAAFITLHDSLFYSLTDTTVRSDIQYSYYLQPSDYFGNLGHTSDTITVRTVDAHQIRLPDHIRAEVVAAKTQVKLTWKFADSKNAIGVRIYRGEENKDTFKKIAERASSETSFIDNGITPDRTYLYYLTSVAANGEESGRTAKIFAVSASDQKPFAPLALSASAEKDGVHLKWFSMEQNLKGCYLYRGEGIHAKLIRLTGIIPFTDSVGIYLDTDKTLSPKRVYSYSVQAISTSSVEGAFSDTAHAQPQGTTTPPTPFKIDALAGERSIKLFWDDVRLAEPTVVGYHVYKRKAGEGEFQKLGKKDLSSENNNFIDSLVESGITYEYFVRSVDAYNGMSENTIAVSATVVSAEERSSLPTPIGLRGEATEDGIVLTWGGILGAEFSGFKIYRAEADAAPAVLKTVASIATSYTDTAVKKDHTYRYLISTVGDKNAESEMSREILITY